MATTFCWFWVTQHHCMETHASLVIVVAGVVLRVLGTLRPGGARGRVWGWAVTGPSALNGVAPAGVGSGVAA
eukprot:12934848-Prorocentrum_lima.AAC.1